MFSRPVSRARRPRWRFGSGGEHQPPRPKGRTAAERTTHRAAAPWSAERAPRSSLSYLSRRTSRGQSGILGSRHSTGTSVRNSTRKPSNNFSRSPISTVPNPPGVERQAYVNQRHAPGGRHLAANQPRRQIRAIFVRPQHHQFQRQADAAEIAAQRTQVAVEHLVDAGGADPPPSGV